MEVVKPKIEYETFDGVKIMKNLERACRTCYRSEDTITKDSYKRLLKNCITRGHESILEHEKITVRMLCDIGVYKDLTRHRAGASFSIESTRFFRTISTAWRIAQAMAWALLEPWAFTTTPLTPSSGAPPTSV